MTKRQTTRDRIVEQARHLFNEQGYEAVTTAALAAHLGMAEGNLWYHFKTKRALLDAIGARYAEVIEQRLRMVPGADAVASYAALLGTMMAEFRAFRFLYRDQRSYGQLAELIEQNARQWTEITFAQLEAHLAALGGAVSGAVNSLLIRKTRDESYLVLVLYPMAAQLAVAAAAMPFVHVPMQGRDLAVTGLQALTGVAGTIALIAAYRRATAATVAPMTYVQMLVAALTGWLFFQSHPDLWTLAGAAVIIGAGLFLWHAGRVKEPGMTD